MPKNEAKNDPDSMPDIVIGYGHVIGCRCSSCYDRSRDKVLFRLETQGGFRFEIVEHYLTPVFRIIPPASLQAKGTAWHGRALTRDECDSMIDAVKEWSNRGRIS